MQIIDTPKLSIVHSLYIQEHRRLWFIVSLHEMASYKLVGVPCESMLGYNYHFSGEKGSNTGIGDCCHINFIFCGETRPTLTCM